MEDLVLVKLGGSIITNPDIPESVKLKEINRLLKEIKLAKEKKKFKIIVGHGGGSFPHVPAKKYRVKEGIINEKSYYGTSLTQDAAARLHRIVFKLAIKNSLNPFSISPSSVCITENDNIKEIFVEPFVLALKLNFTPLTYGDVSLDVKKGVGIISTEEILKSIAINEKINRNFRVKKLIFVSDVDGVYDDDPKLNRKAKFIEKISISEIENVISRVGNGQRKFNVTGGMKEKILKAQEVVRKTGAICQIVNGKKAGNLFKALLDKKIKSTIISP